MNGVLCRAFDHQWRDTHAPPSVEADRAHLAKRLFVQAKPRMSFFSYPLDLTASELNHGT